MNKKILLIFISVFFLGHEEVRGEDLPAWAKDRPTTVVKSRHNLSTTNQYKDSGTEADTANHIVAGEKSTKEVCVFCHTPHGANLDAVGAPIWNKKVQLNAYSMYYSPTIDTPIHTRPTGVSLACLSCHDGTMAMDTMLNAPGSGGYNKEGVSQDYSWTKRKLEGTNDSPEKGLMMPKNAVAWLDVDLRNDHPISMPYAGAVGGKVAYDPKFWPATVIREGKVAAIKHPNNQGTVNVTDGDLRLFRSGDSAEQEKPNDEYLVQCATCHNPHSTDGGEGWPLDAGGNRAYPTFLQRPNTASELCVTCHIK